jgi:hypothetical protein
MNSIVPFGDFKPYYEINREERFFTATLYALLLNERNLRSFIQLLNTKLMPNEKIDETRIPEFEIYVEYAYLRDCWNSLGVSRDKNETKISIIRKSLAVLGISNSELESLKFHDWNRCFVGRGRPSAKYLQNPGTWSIVQIAKSGYFPNTPERNEDFKKICYFKWCFNIKPDLVIKIGKKKVISIEAKLESGEGKYPSNEAEIKVFKDRGIESIKQTKLQRFMFEKLLGLDSIAIYLTKRVSNHRKDDDCYQISWGEILPQLDKSNLHPFVLKAIKSNEYLNQ